MRKLCVAADPRLPSRTTNCKDPSAQTQLEPKARNQGGVFSTSVEHRPPVEGGTQGGGETLKAFESLGLDARAGFDL